MSIIEKVRGKAVLTNTMAFKISDEQKSEVTDFCEERGISFGKLVRLGLERIVEDIKKEEKEAGDDTN